MKAGKAHGFNRGLSRPSFCNFRMTHSVFAVYSKIRKLDSRDDIRRFFLPQQDISCTNRIISNKFAGPFLPNQIGADISGFFINESLVLQISCQAIAFWPSRLEILDKGFVVTFFAKMFPIKFWLKSELHLLQVSANVRPLLRFFS